VRVVFVAVMAWCVSASAQELFRETFDGVVARVDAGGVWTEIYDVSAMRQILGGTIGRSGGRGLRMTRTMPTGVGPDSQFEWVSSTRQGGEAWVRWWMRINATQGGQQQVMNFGDTSVPNHIGLVLDGPNQFVTGYRGNGQFFALPAGGVVDAGYRLYELGVFGMDTADGGVVLFNNGVQIFSGTFDFDFPDAGFLQLNLGFTFGNPNGFLGTIDYDEARVTRRRPVGALNATGEMQPWRVGACVPVRMGTFASDRVTAVPSQEALDFQVRITPPLTPFADPACSLPAVLTIPQGQGSMIFYVQPLQAVAYDVEADTTDVFIGRARVMVQPALDGGPPDAGGADDAGTPDGSVVDAGSDDAGAADAGADDAGLDDAGVFDAGSNDAGALDASIADAGLLDAGPRAPDAGPMDPELLRVGCGCRSMDGLVVVAAALLAFTRRRRATP
jgi:hypothetical protein